MNMPPCSGSICKTRKEENGSLTTCHEDYEPPSRILWAPSSMYTLSQSVIYHSSFICLVLCITRVCFIRCPIPCPLVTQTLPLCPLQESRQCSPLPLVHTLKPGTFSGVLARLITGSARWQKEEGALSSPAEQSLHLILESSTSESIS